MSSYSRPVPPHLKGLRGTQSKPRPTFSSTTVQPPSAPPQHRSRPVHSIANRPSHHPHSLTVDVSSYTHSATQPLSPTSPPSGDAQHSPQPRPYVGYSAAQYVHPAASSTQPIYPSAFPHYVNDVSPHLPYAPPPPPHFSISPYHAHMAYPPRPSHGVPAAGPPHPSHPAMFYTRHPSTASQPPAHYRPSQPYHPSYTMYAPQSSGMTVSRGHIHAQTVQLSSHAPVADSASVVSLSLFDDDDELQQSAVRVKPFEEQKAAESERPTDAAQAELRAICQQFILGILTNKQTSAATPPWRAPHDQNNPIVIEYEALYSQMLALSPSLARQTTSAAVSSGRLSATTAPPASSRLIVEAKPRMSKERRPSKLAQISSAIRSRLSKESADTQQQPASPLSPADAATSNAATAGDESVVASPRHSFSLLIPSFSTLHAVAKVMQLTKRVRKAKELGRKEAEEGNEGKRKAEEAEDEDEADDDKPAATQPVVEDEQQPTRLMINSLQSHSSAAPSIQLSATQPLLSLVPPSSPTSPSSPSSRSPRVFRSRYKKQQELSELQQQGSHDVEPAVNTAVRKPAGAAFSYTMPLPRASVKAGKKEEEQEAEDEVGEKEAHDSSQPQAKFAPATRMERTIATAKPVHRRNVTFAGPAKSATHLRSLSTLPPLPALPSNLIARNSTASSSTSSTTAPTSPATRSTTTTQPIATPTPTNKPRITHHKFTSPSQPRPLLIRSDATRQLYSEKVEAVEQSEKTARQRTATDEKRRLRREQLMDKPVKKWGRRGWPHKSRLHLSADGHLHWNWKGGDKSSSGSDGKCVALKSVRGVVAGLSPVAHKGVSFATSVLCFSVLGGERVLSCECGSVRERDDWMEELRLDVGEAKTRGCVWSGRVLMSIERDASIECVVAEEDKHISFI